MVGASGSGKTNVLLNLILRFLVFDKIYVYTKHLHQEKYKFLKDVITEIENDPDIKDVADLPMGYFAEKIDKMVPLEQMDENKENIIIFDDFVTERKQDKMIDCFIRGRHKNASVIYLSQSYFSTPKDIRLNCSHFIFFETPSYREFNQIANDHCKDMEKEDFKKIFKEATSGAFDFLFLDKYNKNLPLRYRKNFDGLYIPNE
jgi:hypothetical protein